MTFATGPLAKCTTQQSLEVPSSSSRKISARVANQKQGNDATTTLRKQGRTNQRHDYFQERNDEAGAWDRIGCRTYSIAIQVDPTSSMFPRISPCPAQAQQPAPAQGKEGSMASCPRLPKPRGYTDARTTKLSRFNTTLL